MMMMMICSKVFRSNTTLSRKRPAATLSHPACASVPLSCTVPPWLEPGRLSPHAWPSPSEGTGALACEAPCRSGLLLFYPHSHLHSALLWLTAELPLPLPGPPDARGPGCLHAALPPCFSGSPQTCGKQEGEPRPSSLTLPYLCPFCLP